MGFGFNINPKELIYKNILEGMEKYQEEHFLETKFGDPILGFASAENPLFDIFFNREELLHPKAIYRPGNTVILHFLPFAGELAAMYPGNPRSQAAWRRGMKESIMLSARLNGIIRETMGGAGYIVSGTTTPGDWNSEKLSPEWNHKIAAFICGMGDIGFGASLLTEVGAAGRWGGSITDYVMEPSKAWKEKEVDAIRKDINFYGKRAFSLDGIPPERQKYLMGICPAKAITLAGLDRSKCQEYCQGLDMAAPSQDACGLCWINEGL